MSVESDEIERVRKYALVQLATHQIEKVMEILPHEIPPSNGQSIGWVAYRGRRADGGSDRWFEVVSRWSTGTGYDGSGMTVITGDSGDFIWNRSLFWMKRSIDSIHYFAEKVPHGIVTRHYSQDKFQEWLRDEMADAAKALDERDLGGDASQLIELRKAAQEALDADVGECQHDAYEWIVDAGFWDGGDLPDLEVFTPSFLWCRESIKLLLARVEL